ncbi:Pentatricopeptide repeat [Quillaja saponaria]|uniref:Pentatricopeptide repeat n=1 Tax=Quillaja saponaria TaxID=32244 RepID=A0AAD7L0V5_QUISA|nr:Pentatricopeptide repeat [Quillaja saponaria]
MSTPNQASFIHSQPQQSRPQSQGPPYYQNPNSPKLPKHVSALIEHRLNLHNRILTLMHQNGLKEVAPILRSGSMKEFRFIILDDGSDNLCSHQTSIRFEGLKYMHTYFKTNPPQNSNLARKKRNSNICLSK